MTNELFLVKDKRILYVSGAKVQKKFDSTIFINVFSHFISHKRVFFHEKKLFPKILRD